ncbi:phospho-sugar mutase [Lacticaseibacillus parakribbianus]|uniref:phospho-sugar mutase n=1 Tax=Lacticaseibacillus parakribbianus TaxID=2970927 RepID=UPI0021CB4FF8|nr:phospho-sugar mutase [Lacticaseibacillus parakribbianus]
MNEMQRYQDWRRHATADPDLMAELEAMAANPAAIEDAFYRDLAFGTGGLRGTIGAGTNRMNVYTVAKASQGLADYIVANFAPAARSIAVSRDSRHKSDLFAEVAARVFAANGITVWRYEQIAPTPMLSFATRQLHCAAGIMVTASHNPAKYNGYKVYGPDGCQITTAAAKTILDCIERLAIFDDVKMLPLADAEQAGLIRAIPASVFDDFVAAVHGTSQLAAGTAIDRAVSIVYSPINGTGLVPVTRTLREAGFTDLFVVPEQEQPDGDFPTCPFPNPEIEAAMALGIQYAKARGAELVLANDPDCDRVGTAVREADGSYRLLSGNEMGMLLLDYICARRVENGTMPAQPELVKTIVTIDMADRIAAHYGVTTVNLLTGFKFIGEEIGRLEAAGREADYLFGFEESYGYLSGTYVRDKDGVNASFLICEMFAYYKTRGITLAARLAALYRDYGYCLNTLHSYEFDGAAGFAKMQTIMATFREGVAEFGGERVASVADYLPGLDGLPQADVLKFTLATTGSVVVRPSGTEPKLKVYVSVSAADQPAAAAREAAIVAGLGGYFA